MDKNDTFRTGDQSFLIAGAKVQIKIGLYKLICTKNSFLDNNYYLFIQQATNANPNANAKGFAYANPNANAKAMPTQTITQTQNQLKKLITDKLIIFFRSFGVLELRELSILMPLAISH